jgi:DNA-directed RNA polymerase specialized sigma24 family protein
VAKGRNDLERVAAATAGDSAAFGRVFDLWFDRVGDLVWRIVRNRDIAAEVAQASFAAAWEQRETLSRPEDFGPWLLCLSRRQALDRLERDRRPGAAGLTLSRRERSAASSSSSDVAGDGDGDGGGDADQVVWAAYTALGEREASLLDLHLRHHVPAAALAADLDVPADEASLALEHERSRLAVALRAWGLRGAGTDRCPGLTDALAASGGPTHFGESVRVIASHAVGCTACSDAQEALPDPEVQFAAVPVAAAPVAMRAQAAAGLQAAGIEVGTAFSRSKPTGEVETVKAPAPADPPSSPPSPSPTPPPPAPPVAAAARPEPATVRTTTAERLAARGASVHGSTSKPRSLDDFRGGSAYGSAAASAAPAASDGSDGSGAGDATAVSPAPDADPTTPEPVSPPSPPSGSRPQGRRRRLILAAAAALVLAIGLTGIALSAGGSGEDDHRVESGASQPEDDGPFADSDLGVNGPVVDDPSAADGGDRSTTLPGLPSETLPTGETIPPGSGGPDGGTGGTSGGSGGPTVPGDPDDPQVPPGTPTSTTEADDTPSATTTTTVASTTPPPAGAPEITSFRGTVTGSCGLLGLGRSVAFSWHSTGASSATFGPRGGSATSVEPNGGVTRCAAIGTVFQLSVTGPGGSDSATATVPV